MADREITGAFGTVSVTVSMKGAKGGNELLAEAQAQASEIAAKDGKAIVPTVYGTKRVGEEITITFPIKG